MGALAEYQPGGGGGGGGGEAHPGTARLPPPQCSSSWRRAELFSNDGGYVCGRDVENIGIHIM